MSSSTSPKLNMADIPSINLGTFILDKMKEHNQTSVALVDGKTDESYTYQQYISRIELAAAGLQKFGMKKDDVICVISPNHMDYMVAFYATALVYATFQPINPSYTKDDIKRVIRECKTKYILTIPAIVPKVREALDDDSGIKVIVFGQVEGCTSFDSLIDPTNEPYITPEADPKKSVVALMSSSGSTGFPKPIQLSHYCLVALVLQQCNAKLNFPTDVLIVFLPLFHGYGLYVVTITINYIGCKTILMSEYQQDAYLELIQKHRPRFLHVNPPIMVMLAKDPKVSDYDLSSVSTVISVAAPLSKEIERAVKHRLNISCVIQGFWMTEVGMTHVGGYKDNKYRSVGKLLPLVEIKIVNVITNEACKANEEGELWVKGPQVSLGYLNRPDKNAELFTEDGWAKTGDIAYEDEDGYLYIVDRLSELIQYKQFQVAPATLEDIILKHEAVADVGVIGMPDEEAGELPRAYVVKKAGIDITEDELITFTSDHVEAHMKLRGGLEFVTEIKRTESGKILRRTLRERLLTRNNYIKIDS